MEKDDSGSLFDKAAEIERRRRLLKKKKRAESSAAVKSVEQRPIQEDEFSEMFSRMRQMRDDLEGQMLDLYSKAGVSRSTVDEFISDPKNVPESKQQEIEQEVARLEAQLAKILGARAKKVSQKVQEEKQGEKRKHKMIGQRRKWIQM